MTTIDTLLIQIVNQTTPTIEELLLPRDSTVLRSLSTAVTSQYFITENQSKLLVKILKDNQHKISNFSEEIALALLDPKWSKPFRHIDQVRKLYITTTSDNEKAIAIEFTFSSQLRKVLSTATKKIENLIQINPGKLYYADLTERNILELVDVLANHKFTIDPIIQDHYSIIKNWSEKEAINQFLLTSITNQNFHKHITADLGISTPIDQNIITDRSIRYQYLLEDPKKIPETLTELLATRHNTRVWVDRKKHSFEDLIHSLVELKRLPVMFVFDGYNPSNQHIELSQIAKVLDTIGLYDQIGFYFRLPSTPIGKEFNELIAERKYNCVLDKNTRVVGVQSGKIPKFFLTNDWKPMSVVSIGNVLRHSKTAVYSNCCDLIISYTDTDSIIETKNLWQ